MSVGPKSFHSFTWWAWQNRTSRGQPGVAQVVPSRVTSPTICSAPGSDVLDALAVETEQFEVAIPTVAEPNDTGARRIYIDPVYF